MELVRKNIHMDRIKCSAATQITLEDDRNVPDQKPDMERIILQRGEIKTEELKAGENRVAVKGRLQFEVLYATEEGRISSIEGQLPLEEQVYMEGVQNGDNIEISTELEDLSIELINSRKISIRALLSLHLSVDELYDEEMAVELYHDGVVETKKKPLSAAEIALQKKDILRRREELEMPQSFPNIFEIIWKEVKVTGLTFEPLQDQLSVQGELQVFLLYEGEGEERGLKCYEKTLPFREILDCQGSRETMTPNISTEIGHSELEIRTDQDGEERVVCLDLLLELNIKLYELTQLEALTDVYGITENIQPILGKGVLNRQLLTGSGKTKLTEQIKLPAALPDMAEICHSSAVPVIEDRELTEDGLELTGLLTVKILYQAEGGELNAFETQLPFQYVLAVPELDRDCLYEIKPSMEQLTVTMLNGSEADIKAVLGFYLLGFCSSEEELITDITVEETDTNVTNELPGIVVYFAREGDDVWKLGKKYYVPLERIRELNQLGSDTLKAGEKLLIVR